MLLKMLLSLSFCVTTKSYKFHMLLILIILIFMQQKKCNSQPISCSSIDVRNDCDNLLQLKNCTVIKGYLMIVLLPKASNSNGTEKCDYEKYRFPLLREITDYMIFFDVKGLKNIRDMFPNLTVIRGRRLFLNYALGISSMPDLETLEFRSLVAIQRGHVFIGSSPKLCQLDNIDWSRLTLTPGENHIFPVPSEQCGKKSHCMQCNSGHCWSNDVCQIFENDDVPNLNNSDECDAECLGGCYNATKEGCVVCKDITDHGACVKECPQDKFLLEHYQRCYTKDECVNELGLYTNSLTCVPECPSGFMGDEQTHDCIACANCTKVCNPEGFGEVITIFNLGDADLYNGCRILNASVLIAIRNKVSEVSLMHSLSTVTEIRGHLKIYRSPHLTSLKFLTSLRKISGYPLENDIYSFIVYDNKNLREFWPEKQQLELERGSMYIHSNDKLCNYKLSAFQRSVKHDQSRNSIQRSDQDVLCGPEKLKLYIEVLSHSAIKLFWKISETSDQIEIIYRLNPSGNPLIEKSELDSDICKRINWQRRLMFRSELQNNGTHYNYVIDDLIPNTKYVCLIKTFGIENDHLNARSVDLHVTTKNDIPKPPELNVVKKTDTSLTIKITQAKLNYTIEYVNYYTLEVYEFPDNTSMLDKRSYCEHPFYFTKNLPLESYDTTNEHEDYDECCTRLADEADNKRFQQNMREEFRCSLDNRDYCVPTTTNYTPIQRVRDLRLQSNETTRTLLLLERYRLYGLQVQSCNEVGCSAYAVHYERTNYSSAADKLDDLRACRVAGTQNLIVAFSEPKHPNSAILMYVIHYRLFDSINKRYKTHLNCVTRIQHEQANFRFLARTEIEFNEVAVRVHSLAGDVLTDWVNVTNCDETELVGLKTKLAGIGGIYVANKSHGLNIFLIFFLIGASSTFLWVCYKRRYWRKFSDLRRYMPIQSNLRALIMRPEANAEDRQILVDEFETANHFISISNVAQFNSFKQKHIFIVAATRTPIGKFEGCLSSLGATLLGGIAIENVIKQAAVPHNEVDAVYFGNVFTAGVGQAPARQAALHGGIHKSVCCTTINQKNASGLKSIIVAAQTLQLPLGANIVLAGGMESSSNVPFYVKRGIRHYGDEQLYDEISTIESCIRQQTAALEFARNSLKSSTFDAELTTVRISQKRKPDLLIEADELLIANEEEEKKINVTNLADGAAAVVLANTSTVERLKLTPLARILDYQEVESIDLGTAAKTALQQMLERNDCRINCISKWEIDLNTIESLNALISAFAIDKTKVNINGDKNILGNPMAMTGARLITHLTHTLQFGQLGFAIISNGAQGVAAMMIEKLKAINRQLPLLTLYTKDPCPLCDTLIEELDCHFAEQFELEKVDITEKENLRFLRLYRYDIPVLFLNGQFLCMHKLNKRLLSMKLQELRELNKRN